MALNKMGKTLLICTMLVGGSFFLILKSMPDSAIGVVSTWNIDTEYKVLDQRFVNVPYTGRLGQFYDCLTKYRHISKRRISKPIVEDNGRLVIKVANAARLTMAVNSKEAYSIQLVEQNIDGKAEDYSNNYAINCDVDLLNK